MAKEDTVFEKTFIVLVSSSPRRKELLENAGINFIVFNHKYDEDSHIIKSPEKYVMELASHKIQHIENDINDDLLDKPFLGVDTIVYHRGKILGKPKNSEEALENIKKMSGDTHYVYSGIAINYKGKIYTDFCKTQIKFSNIDNNFLKYYIDKNFYSGYAGGYAIQNLFSLVVEKINGSYTNVVGLPMETLYKMLLKLKLDVFKY